MFRYFFILVFSIVFSSCHKPKEYIAAISDAELLHASMKNLTDIIVHDIFSPPVASRIYVYPSIAAFETIAQLDTNYISFYGQLNGFPAMQELPISKDIVPELAALFAFNKVAEVYIFSSDKMDAFQSGLLIKIRESGAPKKVIDNSLKYGEAVAEYIINWAKADLYSETRSFPRYTVDNEPGTWKPTPPKYMDGIEPHWREIRTMVIENSSQFRPESPTVFDISKDSKFYKETMEVYNTVKDADKEMIEIASFWDCNPYVMNLKGHLMFATKKITPGGHWMGITRLACEKSGSDFRTSAMAYALCSIALFDGFISCWDEKYRSNLIRPETVINEYIDPEWKPALQTPPFPEHTSGHSVISSAAAIVLTSVFGDNFDFEDTVELEFGLPSRKFKSFIQASEEAAISRLYGGIHYRPAIDLGVTQGISLAKYIIDNIKVQNLPNS